MGSDEIYDALLKQSGAIRVDTMEELFDYATAFSKQPLPTARRFSYCFKCRRTCNNFN